MPVYLMLFKVKYLRHLFLLKHSMAKFYFYIKTYFLVAQAMRKKPRHVDFWGFMHVYKL